MSFGLSDSVTMKGEQQNSKHIGVSKEGEMSLSNNNNKNQLINFVQDLKQKQPNFNKDEVFNTVGESSIGSRPANVAQSIEEIKLYTPDSAQHVYSVNVLLKMQQNIPESVVNSIMGSLPKKSFWRLTGRAHHEVRNSHAHNKESGVHEKKNSRGRNSKNGGRRGNQTNNNNNNQTRTQTIESLKDVSRDELLAMEEKLQPTGNSMADFEKWRAQVRELERKKKGGVPLDKDHNDKLRHSSFSDFFNFKKEEHVTFDELEPPEPCSATPKGSSSRFSSFFSNRLASSTNQVYENNTKVPANTLSESSARANCFRLMSLFNKDDKGNESIVPHSFPENLSTPADFKERPISSSQPSFLAQQSETTEQSSQFFQSLMIRGKANATNTQEKLRPISSQNPQQPSQQILEKLISNPAQTGNVPPGLAKANISSNNVPNVPPPGFPMHFGPPHISPPMNGQIPIPPPGFQNFTMVPHPGMFNGANMNGEQGPGGAQQQSVQPPHHQQSLNQRQENHHQQRSDSHLEFQQDNQQDVQQGRNLLAHKCAYHSLPPQFMNASGGIQSLPSMQVAQPQFGHQSAAGFPPTGPKMIPQPPNGFASYNQGMMPQPQASGFGPYSQKISQLMGGFSSYGQAIPLQLQQQKK